MNWNIIWTVLAVSIYWLAWFAFGTDNEGTDNLRNLVAFGGIAIAFANVLRYMPNAWEKYQSGASAGEWRMLMGLELFWLGFGAREIYLMGDRLGHWSATHNPLNGFFAFWILCAGLLCFSAASEPMPLVGRQNVWIIGLVGLAGVLTGMIVYRMIWG